MTTQDKLDKRRRTSTHCSECGYRIRGKNHKDGEHHKSRVK